MRDLALEIARTDVSDGALAIWWLGQASFIVKGAGRTVAFDPFLSYYPGDFPRTFPPLLQPGDLTGIDLVCCSHEHSDHVDPWTLGPIAKASPGARFVVPAGCVRMLVKEAGIDRARVTATRAGQGPGAAFAGEPFEAAGLTVTPLTAAHEQVEWSEEAGQRFQGFAIRFGAVSVVHMGDCAPFPGMVEMVAAQHPDVLLAPINGRDFFRTSADIIGNMDVREAAELAVRAGARLVVPYHFDLVAHNGEQPGRFVDYLFRWHPEQPFKVMARGERFLYLKGDNAK